MRRTKLAAIAALAAVSLTGCAGLRPGVAAEVGDEQITMERVDAFAEPLCRTGLLGPNFPTAGDNRRVALAILVRAELAATYASEFREELVPADIDRPLRENVAPAVADLPEEEREQFLDEVRSSIEGDQLASQAAAALLTAQGQELTQESVIQASQELFNTWAEVAGVELDPRFGSWSEGNIQAASGSLSAGTAGGSDPATGPAARSCPS